ncbi:MAG: galactokinase [Candidatus Hydrogenedentales bacterium]|jgi:galactokinase
MSIDVSHARTLFREHFGKQPEKGARAPGRVNIVGEHTDYNHGFVLPMAIERDTVILASKRSDFRLHAYAANFDRRVEVDLTCLERSAEEPWIDYVIGVARELSMLGKPICGLDCLIVGDVPVASGLSSSASLEMAALALFEQTGGFTLSSAAAAQLGQRVENEFLGLSSGIMDQFISRAGEAGSALFLDCRTHAFEQIPVAFSDATFLIADTQLPRKLSASKYNERVAECREAVAALCRVHGAEATHLRDFSLGQLEEAREAMSEVAFRRARHVISEDIRTLAACDAMRSGDAVRLGVLMSESDASLRADYEVTCAELDAMTAISRSMPGCFGARMTGAGFGGCTVHLVALNRVNAFGEELLKRYRVETGQEGALIVSAPAAGAGPVNV